MQIFDLVERCELSVDEDTSVFGIQKALHEVELMCYCISLNESLKYQPAYTMHGKHISTLLILNGRKDARLVPNRIYFRMLSSLLRSKSMTTWTTTVHIEGYPNLVTVHYRKYHTRNGGVAGKSPALFRAPRADASRYIRAPLLRPSLGLVEG